MSFTTGGLFHVESVKLAQLYVLAGNWDSVRHEVAENNILQARTINTLKRVSREVISRLSMLSMKELRFLVAANHQEQAQLLWLAVCRRYRFIADFSIEVLRERYISLKRDLTPEDYDAFFNRKAEWHPELDKIQLTTRNKLRQVLFRMLREADLLGAGNVINGAMLSPGLINLIISGSRQEMLYFPMFESDMGRAAK